MNYSPLVSVIIPNYNHASYLQERIESVLNQSYSNFEVIILDDCSTDNSRDIIEIYRGHEKINQIEYNTTNSGSTFKQWQKGINIAKGEWIWIAESDDVADNKFLATLMNLATRHSSHLVFCNSLIVNKDGENCPLYGFWNMPSRQHHDFFNNDFKEKSNEFVKNWMLKDNFIPNASAVVFSKKSLENISKSTFPFISKMRLMGDWVFWIEILNNIEQVSYSSNQLNKFRTHNSNVRETKYKERILEMFLIAKYFGNYPYIKSSILDGLLYRYLYKSNEINLSFKDHVLIISKIIYNKRFLRFIKTLVKRYDS